MSEVRSEPASTDPWPVLTLSKWEDTRDTLHLWSQVVGKVRLALEPMINHWWQVPLYVSARGLTTSLMHVEGRGLELELDFIDHVLLIRTSRGEVREVRLQPQSVADFYAATIAALDDLGISLQLMARPVEVPEAIPFAADTELRAYDPDAAQRFWWALLQSQRVMHEFRGRFIGKVSPVHFFWGSFDLAVSRFSGRLAPKHPGGVPNCADFVQELAYSHELSSAGFWPGGSEEGSFYSYAYPTPEGFADWPVAPAAAYFDKDLGEFLLPYQAVRTSADPDAMLLEFLQSTYEAAATLAQWDRAALEAKPMPVGSTGDSKAPEVFDDVPNHRFAYIDDGQVAELIYQLRGDRFVLVHTEVPDSLGGRGIAGSLVQAAVDRADREGLTVVPVCRYARMWLRQHPDQAARVAIDSTPPQA
ncbi:MAG TPA: DUF5996 family protein [Candidatus Nanopelagicales bacterium]|jgi:predicted GNAT family acetyltransferase